MKIQMIFQPTDVVCSMKDCTCKEGKHYIELQTMFPNISEKHDHLDLQEHQGIVSSFETNLRPHPTVLADVVGQLYSGDVVTILKQQEPWLYVESNEKKGWVNASSIEITERIRAREQLKGETHRALICEDCLNTLNWERFYVEEIEPKQHHHVINNLMLSYAEVAIALEDELEEQDEVSFEALKKRVHEEIYSGEHGPPHRFNEEELLKYYHTKRIQ